jgi:hypothetical protein
MNECKKRKEVVGVRLADEDHRQLEFMAKNKGTTVSALCAQFLHKYLNFYFHAEHRREISLPRPMINILYDSLDKTKIQNIVDMSVRIAKNDLKIRFDELTYDTITHAVEVWFDHNQITFTASENHSIKRYGCRHGIGKNWSEIMAKTIMQLLKDVGCVQKNIEVTEDLFVLEFRTP